MEHCLLYLCFVRQPKKKKNPQNPNTLNYCCSLRGISMVVVILMIGTGWSFLKPYLSNSDKYVFMIVIPLQIIANVALVILGENMRGFSGFEGWVRLVSHLSSFAFHLLSSGPKESGHPSPSPLRTLVTCSPLILTLLRI